MIGPSPLDDAGGFVVTRLASASEINAMRREAARCYRTAVSCRVPHPPAGPEAPGQPDRWLDVATGGEALRAFFQSSRVLAHLERLAGVACRPNGTHGMYSYYRAAGHYLGVHRDVVGCDLAMITCISDTGADDDLGGELVVYPGAAALSLTSVRADPHHSAHTIRLREGDSAILIGSTIPHRVTPLEPRRIRVVAPLCYHFVRPTRLAAGARPS